jgi:hypothetical protein
MPTATAPKNDTHKDSDQPVDPAHREIVPKGKVTIKEEVPEGVVIGEGGTITRPTVVTVGNAFYKEGNDHERFAGKVLLEGDTHVGYHYKFIAEVPQALTKEGLFHVFKSHLPDAVAEGFKFQAIDNEEAEKLSKEWAAEREGKKPKKDK